jgi:hypothetical protein
MLQLLTIEKMLLQQTSRVGFCRDSQNAINRIGCRRPASVRIRVAAAATQHQEKHEEAPRSVGLGGLAWSAAAFFTAVASPVLAEEETYEAVQAALQANAETAPQVHVDQHLQNHNKLVAGVSSAQRPWCLVVCRTSLSPLPSHSSWGYCQLFHLG